MGKCSVIPNTKYDQNLCFAFLYFFEAKKKKKRFHVNTLKNINGTTK